MKKKVNRFLLCFLPIYILLTAVGVDANQIKKIDMDVYIDEAGTASITEVWDAVLSSGSEGYKVFKNIEKERVAELSVTDEKGNVYTCADSWFNRGDLSYKANKCAIVESPRRTELYWGISNYGEKKYVLKYKIYNMVTQYEDAQGLYFDFLSLNETADYVKVTISSIIPFSKETVDVSKYGYDGTLDFRDGMITLSPNGKFTKEDDVVVLMKFKEQPFETVNRESYSFWKVRLEAFKREHAGLFTVLILLGVAAAIFIVRRFVERVLRYSKKRRIIEEDKDKYDFGTYGKKLPKDVQKSGVLPSDDLYRAYWVASNYEVIKEDTLNQNIIGAMLLKLIKQSVLKMVKQGNSYSLEFAVASNVSNIAEAELLKILKDAAGNDGLLREGDFKEWYKKDEMRMYFWTAILKTEIENMLIDKGLLISNEAGNLLVSSMLRDEAIKIEGFVKFLCDEQSSWSSMDSKDFNDHLILAELFGLSKEAKKKLTYICEDEDIYKIRISSFVPNDIYKKFKERVISSKKDPMAGEIFIYSVLTGGNNESTDSSSRDSLSGGSASSSDSFSRKGSSGGGFR